jgi:iron-sulfur cluster repair protein YtfE (RIC family)
MQRHQALRQLSRDHHHALVVARALKRADDTNADETRARFLDYWLSDGQEHFREEEEILLPALARFADPAQPIVARVLTDHVRIRCLAQQTELSALRELGSQLEQHIGREERELFPLIESAIPDGELRRLAELLVH